MVRHCDDAGRASGRPTPLPPPETARAGGERPRQARAACGRMARELTGSLDVDEGIRLGGSVPQPSRCPAACGPWTERGRYMPTNGHTSHSH